MNLPSIETQRLILRQFSSDDADHLMLILNKEDVTRYLAGSGAPTRQQTAHLIERITAHWEKHGYGWWAVTLKGDPQVIGWCGLGYLEETDETELLYMLDVAHWGKGYATEAARASLRYAFESTDLQRVIALSFPENTASQKVIEKSSLRFVKKGAYFGYQLLCYEILRGLFTRDEEAFYKIHPGEVKR